MQRTGRRVLRGLASLLAFSVLMICPAGVGAQQCDDEFVLAPGPVAGEFFGKSVAIDGSTMVVGAPGSISGKSAFPGRAFVYEWQGGHWRHQATLAFEQSAEGDAFGMSVDIDGGTIVIGAPRMFNHLNDRTGIAFVYEQPPGGWISTDQPDAFLHSLRGARNDLFGCSVAIDDDWILVGSPGDDANYLDAGSVSTFKRDPESRRGWRETEVVFRPSPKFHEHFGGAVAISGDWAVVGAPNVDWHTTPGSVHFYQRDENDVWVHRQALNGGPGRLAGDHFGRALALDRRSGDLGSVLVVGATGTDPNGEHSGSGYVFRYMDTGNGPRWIGEQWLVPADNDRGDHFGFSLSIMDDTLLVGAHAYDLPERPNVGTVYVYRFQATNETWIERRQLLAECPHAGDALGFQAILFRNPDDDALEAMLSAPGYDRDDQVDAGVVLRFCK